MRLPPWLRIDLAAVVLPMLLHAQTVIVNGSFESPALTTNQNFVGSFAFEGWSGASTGESGNAGLVLGPNWGLPAFDGRQSFIFNGNNPVPGTYIEQTVSTSPGASYQLTFAIGRNASAPEQVLGLRVDIFNEAGGLVFSCEASPPASTGFRSVTMPFVANSAATRLRITDVSAWNPNTDVAIDAVSITEVRASILVNGDFELPALVSTENFFGPFAFAGWVGESTGGTGNAGLVVGTDWGLGPADGRQMFIFNGNNPLPGTYIEQAFLTHPGVAYDVGFSVGRNACVPEQLLALRADVFNRSGDVLSSILVDAPGSGIFAGHKFHFVADSGFALLRFTDVSGDNPLTDIALDSVRVTAVTDAGPTIALASAAFLAVAVLRRKFA